MLLPTGRKVPHLFLSVITTIFHIVLLFSMLVDRTLFFTSFLTLPLYKYLTMFQFLLKLLQK